MRGSSLSILTRGSTAWPYPHTSRVAEAARGPRGTTSCPSGLRAALSRGSRPAAMWRGEREGREPRLSSHQCAVPQPSLTAFNAVRADVRYRATGPCQIGCDRPVVGHVRLTRGHAPTSPVSGGVEVGTSHYIGASSGVLST